MWHVLDHRHVGHGRQQVVHERGGDRVAVVVVGEVLEQRAADPLHGAAVDLALHDVRVDHRPAVLAHDVAEQRDGAGGRVDLAGAHVGGVGPDHRRLGLVAAARLEPGRHAGRHRPRVGVGDGGDLGQR